MPSTDAGVGPAQLLFTGGAIYTMEDAQPRADALAVRGERILAVGDAQELTPLRGPATRVVELGGRALVPGFVDAHIHFGWYARSRREVDLDQAATLEAGLALVRAAAERLPDDAWIHGRGWDRHRWGRLLGAIDLDGAVGPRRAVLRSHDGHALWCSSAVLAAAGVDAGTPDPPGGRVERLEDGRPSGVLFENAQALVERVIPEPGLEETIAAIREALPSAAAAGVTGIHNLEDARTLRAFTRLWLRGELTLRVFHGIPRAHLRAAARVGVETGLGDNWLRVGLVKLFADGTLGSETAYLLEPYVGRDDGYRGIPTLEPEELRADLLAAARAGLGVAVHAIGDAAVRNALDAIAWARAQDPLAARALYRIEHAQLVHPDDFARFAQLDVVASMQPTHAVADWRAADEHWGPRSRTAYAWRSLLDAGVSLAFGTDAPVERIEPLRSLYAAVARRDESGVPAGGWYPEQALRLHEAVRAYTRGAAHAERADARKGSLTPGKLADLVVLSGDPFARGVEALLETDVDTTVVGGRIVHER